MIRFLILSLIIHFLLLESIIFCSSSKKDLINIKESVINTYIFSNQREIKINQSRKKEKKQNKIYKKKPAPKKAHITEKKNLPIVHKVMYSTEKIIRTDSIKQNIKTNNKIDLKKKKEISSVSQIAAVQQNNISGPEKQEILNEILEKINKTIIYPEDAVKRNIEGEVVIRVIIDGNTFLKNAQIIKPHYFKSLNSEVLRVIKQVFPLNRHIGKELILDIPINFVLN